MLLIIAIVFYFIGAIFIVDGFRFDPDYVTQQTIQYLSLLIGVVCCGFGSIILAMRHFSQNKEKYNNEELGNIKQNIECIEKYLNNINNYFSKYNEKVDIDLENSKEIKKEIAMEKFKNTKKFVYADHEDAINDFTTAKEINDYIKELNIDDEYFISNVIPELTKQVEIERMYGNLYKEAKNILKELTT